ncbi:apical endosomal glycoprotein [Limosa lapponica baueri]|uniref:Apical endosomal glycoprotein n=1 Tax=Limosa lapponica baueri TaxID=1758121 RepID=A0A2I0TBF9_LIMLA|nr:apical endosomal glycoprotein [Limosa lapponica baueri]
MQATCALCHLLRAPCPDPHGVFSPVVSPVAGTVLPGESTVVNSCSSAAEQLCDFVCNCSDCSDENQCGYLRGSAVLGTPFTCDFEEGDCGWQDVSTSTYRWVRGQANLATWGTGPYSDHTVGTDLGWFMVTVSPPEKSTATAWLRSPVMREAAATCEISAWFHLSGSGPNQTEQPVLRLAMVYGDEVVGLWQSPERRGEGWQRLVAYPGRVAEQFQLVLYCHLHGSATSSLSISYVTNSTKQLVRERMGDLGSSWVRERVDFNVTEKFKVLIEGVASGTGIVAIDDLILSPGCVQGELEGSRPPPLLQCGQQSPGVLCPWHHP